MTTPKKHPVGIRRTKTGWQAYVHLRSGMRSKRFPPETPLIRMKAWRNEQRARESLGAALPPPESTLLEDVYDYLQQRQTMPTIKDRTACLLLWVDAFGPARDRRTITVGEIRAQLEAWRAAGYAANTCNLRRTALMSLFTVLDAGKPIKNIVRDVPGYRDDSQDDPPHVLSPIAAALILDEMPESLTRARLNLFAWTGWPFATQKRIEPSDIRWNDAVRLRPRRKGKGSKGAWLPLLPPAWKALEDFKRLGAWGPTWASRSINTMFKRAAARVRTKVMLPLDVWAELGDVWPYQLRHSFGSLMAAITKDDRAVMTLMQHSDIRMTHRYTASTADPRAVAAIALVADAMTANRAETVPPAQDPPKQA